MLKSNKVCFPDLSSTVLTEYNPASFLSQETIGLAISILLSQAC